MTTTLHRFSEPFAPSGSMSAEGARNTLGRPKLGLPELLVRETLQNSCDAHDRSGSGPVRYGIDHRRLSAEERAALRRALSDVPDERLGLGPALAKADLRCLVIADRGTTGLGGPTRADSPSGPGEPRGFVDLLRNVGQTPDRHFGAGTYGYGKSVLFRASTAATIVVHTRCRLADGRLEARLLATALGKSHEADGVLMTGRHWWGLADPVVGAEPLLDAEADGLAAAIGMGTFDGTGTTILVIDPATGDDPMSTARRFVDAGLHYAWPRLAGVDGIPGLTLSVSVDGTLLPIPDPRSHPRLAGFVVALEKLHAGYGDTLKCGNPKQDLGLFAAEVVSPAPPAVPHADEEDVPAGPLDSGVHHTALMRHAHLVIGYREGPRHPVPDVGWAGVFVADDEVDEAFAQAEPPSHDDWNHELLPARSHQRTFVKVAKREIGRAVERLTTPSATGNPTGPTAGPLGRLADGLSGLVGPVSGPGPGGDAGGGGGGGGSGQARARVEIERHRLEETADGPVRVVDFTVRHRAGTTSTTVDARVAWALDEGGTDVGGPTPTGWRDNDGVERPPGPLVVIGDDTWSLCVPQGDGLGLVVDISPSGSSA